MKNTLLIILSVLINITGFSQNDGDIDTTFTSPYSYAGNIFGIQVQSDGKIILINSSNNSVVRLNNDGTFDNTFTPAYTNGILYCVKLLTDGKILIGGNFTTCNGQNANRVVKLNSNGSIDNTFQINSATITGGAVYAIEVQPDGKVLIGGSFYDQSSLSNSWFKYFLRLNINGQIDSSASNYLHVFRANAPIHSIKYQSIYNTTSGTYDSKILLGGEFTNYANSNKGIVRINGNDCYPDNSFNAQLTKGSYAGKVSTIELDIDGYIMAGGSFSNYNWQSSANPGINVNNLVRLDPITGALASNNFSANFVNTLFQTTEIESIAVQNDRKVLIGGYYTNSSLNSDISKFTRLNESGNIDGTFNTGTGFNNPSGNSSVNVVKLQSDGKILVGGYFRNYNGTENFHISRLKGTSTLSTNDFSKNKITLYPNPTKDFLNFTLLETNAAITYEINNLLGEKVSYGDLNTNSISVSDLANGVYIIKVKTNEGVFTSKFIKE